MPTPAILRKTLSTTMAPANTTCSMRWKSLQLRPLATEDDGSCDLFLATSLGATTLMLATTMPTWISMTDRASTPTSLRAMATASRRRRRWHFDDWKFRLHRCNVQLQHDGHGRCRHLCVCGRILRLQRNCLGDTDGWHLQRTRNAGCTFSDACNYDPKGPTP